MRVSLLGFGLIGGSIARAVGRRRSQAGAATGADDHGKIRLVAWSPSGGGPRAAAADGLVEAAGAPEEAIAGADLVILAAPPLACLRLLDSLAGEWRSALDPRATVTDVASTKRTIVGRAETLALPFVGGHPMAGREQTGYGASDADLLAGRPWVVVPGRTSRAVDVERVERLALACGARPLQLGAAEHDAAVAAVSHLPLVLAAALVEGVEGVADGTREVSSERDVERALAAGGWRSMTRLARGDPAMGAGILATNADEVARRIRAFRVVLDDWLASLEASRGPDAALLERRLRADAALLGAMAPDAPQGVDPGRPKAMGPGRPEAAGSAPRRAPDDA